ncbi:MAG: hypothetical protein QOH84_4290 [Kribbellaceae bacterium]|nr:hypothetical protein [Kribbellaceae bacterium]
MRIRKLAAGAHVLLAAAHVYWATGATWPAPDERSLSRSVSDGRAPSPSTAFRQCSGRQLSPGLAVSSVRRG